MIPFGIPYGPLIKYGGIALAAAAIGGYILVLNLQISHRDTTIAQQRGQIDVMIDRVQAAQLAVRQAEQANKDSSAAFEAARSDHAKSVAALTDQLRRTRLEKQKTVELKKVIHEESKACAGVVPPGIGRAVSE